MKLKRQEDEASGEPAILVILGLPAGTERKKLS